MFVKLIFLINFLQLIVFHVASGQNLPDLACGEDGTLVEGIFGTISSPNYPSDYPDDALCHWTITVPNGMRISVKFEPDFSIEAVILGPGIIQCLFDGISFSEPNSTDTRTVCGGTGESLISDGNVFIVEFFTDRSIAYAGFYFNWTAVDADTIPAPVFSSVNATTGTISSPNFPNNYEPFSSYVWEIYGTPNALKVIEFEQSFSIEGTSDSGCPYDSLVIGSIFSSGNDKKFCGEGLPEPYLIRDSNIWVNFTSDVSVESTGFFLRYREIVAQTCGGDQYQTGEFGVVSTSLYPFPYGANLNCAWFVSAPENTLIALRFEPLFEIEYSAGCIADYLQIYDGPTVNSTKYQGNICGEQAPANFLSTSNALTIRFVSHSVITGERSGFSFNWTAEAACEVTEFRCWDGTCIDDSLKCNGVVDCPDDVADEAVCSGTVATTRNCGVPDVPPIFKWDHRIIGGHVVEKGSWPWQGAMQVLYQGSWTFMCGAMLLSEEWAMTAAHCVGDKGLKTRVLFGGHIRSEPDPEAEQTSEVEAFFVHPEYKHEILEYSVSNGSDVALLLLETPVNITKWVKPVCLPTAPLMAGTTLVITGWGVSIDAPGNQDILRQVRVPVLTDKRCTKGLEEIDVPDTIFCAAVETGGLDSCSGDSGGPAVKLVNGTWEVAGIVSFGEACALRGKPGAYANVYTVLPYINDVLENGADRVRNRRVEYRVINGKSSGVITSPNYDTGKYDQGTFIRWFINGPDNKVLAVRIDSNISIEIYRFGDPCGADYLFIYDGQDTAAMKYGNKKICGNRLPPPDFESNSNSIIVEFWADYAFEYKGFSIRWTAVDACETDQFRCWDTTCITGSAKCNDIIDCDAEEDEMQCARGQPTSAECGKAPVAPNIPWNPLIVGGYNARDGAWPWQVALYVLGSDGVWAFVCGGTLLDEYTVMTASHCLFASLRYQVSVGDYDLSTTSLHKRKINVTYQIRNPEYFGGINDIGFLKLEEPVDFISRWTKPICLPSSNNTDPKINTTCINVGWGGTGGLPSQGHATILQQSHMRILDDAKCRDMLSTEELQRHFICAGLEHERAGSCFGDSGGPLMCLVDGTWIQYGIASFPVQCGDRAYFQRVSVQDKFIQEALNFVECSVLTIQEGMYGTVMSPAILGIYPPNQNCSWLLRGPNYTVLVIKFEFLDIEMCQRFIYDHLNVYDGNSTSERKFLDEELCGVNRAIRGFESSTNEVLITFISDFNIQENGFKINWQAVADCDTRDFRCWNGNCIDRDSKCNQQFDCSDKSDEAECAQEGSDQCGKQDIEPDFIWPARVVGGSFARNGSWPFQVGLRSRSSYFCAGTIIDPRWILTSAQCVGLALGEIWIVAGQTDPAADVEESEWYGVEETYIPNEYVIEDGYNIGLLKLNRGIELSSFVQPACVAIQNTTEDLETGETCVLLGFGHTKNSSELATLLRQTRVPIIEENLCEKIWDERFHRDRMFCGGNLDSGGVGACSGDRGGAVMCYRENAWVQFGVITNEYGCGMPGTPDLYTKMSFFTNWIEQTIGGQLPSPEPWPTTTTSSVETTPSKVTTKERNMTVTMTTEKTIASSTTTLEPTVSTTSQKSTKAATTTTSASKNLMADYLVIFSMILVIKFKEI